MCALTFFFFFLKKHVLTKIPGKVLPCHGQKSTLESYQDIFLIFFLHGPVRSSLHVPRERGEEERGESPRRSAAEAPIDLFTSFFLALLKSFTSGARLYGESTRLHLAPSRGGEQVVRGRSWTPGEDRSVPFCSLGYVASGSPRRWRRPKREL